MLSIIVSMFLYQAGASAFADAPGLAALEIEVVDSPKILVHGRVTRGGNGVMSTLFFAPDPLSEDEKKSTTATAKSDVSGAYEARLSRGALYGLRIQPDEGATSVEKFHLITENGEDQAKDFALSSNTFTVTILDAKTRDPIPDAKLIYIDSDGPQSPKADSVGRVTIESIPSGSFHCTAVAKGYVNAVGDWTIVDQDDPQTFQIEMTPKSEGNDFQVLMPDGTPAADAFAYYRYDPETRSRVRIPCDSEGVCHPGERPGDDEVICISHADAGLTVLLAQEIYAFGSATLWPSGGPLVINVKSGPKSSKGCEGLIVAIRGTAVDTAGTFTCGSTPWPLEVANLPAGPIEVTIVSKEADDRGRFTPGVRLAGPVPVTLPSDPVEIALP